MQKTNPYLVSDLDPASWLAPMKLVEQGFEVDPTFKSIGTERTRIIKLIRFDSVEERNSYLLADEKPKVNEYEDALDFVSMSADSSPGSVTEKMIAEGWVLLNYNGTKNLVQLKKPKPPTLPILPPTELILPLIPTPTIEPVKVDLTKIENPISGEAVIDIAEAVTLSLTSTPEAPETVAFKPASGGKPIAEFKVTPEAIKKAEEELSKIAPPKPVQKKARLVSEPTRPQQPVVEIDKSLLGCAECINNTPNCTDAVKRTYMAQVNSIKATIANSCPEWITEKG